MRVWLTGATGYVGHGLVPRLLEAGHTVRCLVRDASKLEQEWLATGQVEAAIGDILQPDTLAQTMQGCDAVIHLVGIIREKRSQGVTFQRVQVDGTRHVVEAAQKAGVQRFLHMSALGTRAHAASPYHQAKWEAEEIVRGSGLTWTIYRPSVIYGPGDEFVNMLADVLQKAPVFPIFGSGQFALQPISREDVAAGFVKALDMPQTIGQIYEVGGPHPVPYSDLIQIIGRAIGKPRIKTFSIPVALVKPVVSLMEGFSFFPITSSMLSMLVEGNTCDPTRFAKTFELELTPFAAGIARYL